MAKARGLSGLKPRLTGVDLDLSGVGFNPTVERLSLTAVDLDLTGIGFNLTIERLRLTTVDLDLTGVGFNPTVESLGLTTVERGRVPPAACRSFRIMRSIRVTRRRAISPGRR